MLIAVTFHLPTTDNDGNSFSAIDISMFVTQVIERAGGITIIQAEGAWLNNDRLYRETVLRISAGIDEDEVDNFVNWVDRWIKTNFDQETLWVEVDGKPSIR